MYIIIIHIIHLFHGQDKIFHILYELSPELFHRLYTSFFPNHFTDFIRAFSRTISPAFTNFPMNHFTGLYKLSLVYDSDGLAFTPLQRLGLYKSNLGLDQKCLLQVMGNLSCQILKLPDLI